MEDKKYDPAKLELRFGDIKIEGFHEVSEFKVESDLRKELLDQKLPHEYKYARLFLVFSDDEDHDLQAITKSTDNFVLTCSLAGRAGTMPKLLESVRQIWDRVFIKLQDIYFLLGSR